jgi:hypothetical protein
MAAIFLVLAVATFLAAVATAFAAGFARGREARTVAASFITMEHLRSGKATRAEWTQVIATVVAIVSFGALFFGIGWLVWQRKPMAAIVMVLVPALWLFGAFRDMWSDWRAAKRTGRDAGEPTAGQERQHR